MNKERLEELKKMRLLYEVCFVDEYASAIDDVTSDFDSLIEQAERLEEMENDNTITMTLDQYGKLLGKANRVQELEEEFEVGDWIYSKQVEKFIKIEDEGQLEGYNKFPSYYRSATPEEIAEEKQRRWWAKHGREVKELKKGDVLIDAHNDVYVVSKNMTLIELGIIQSFLISYDRIGKGDYEVLCFVEDRKDIE